MRCLNALRFTFYVSPILVFAHTAAAQVGGGPVHQGSGPLSELSTNVGAGSGPVSGAGGSIRAGSPGRLSGNSVRESVTGDVLSGPVSDVTVGAVTADQPVTGGAAVSESSAGAV